MSFPTTKEERGRLLLQETQDFLLRHREHLEGCLVAVVWLPKGHAGPADISAASAGLPPGGAAPFIAMAGTMLHAVNKLVEWHCKEAGITDEAQIALVRSLINTHTFKLSRMPPGTQDSTSRRIDLSGL